MLYTIDHKEPELPAPIAVAETGALHTSHLRLGIYCLLGSSLLEEVATGGRAS